MSPTELVPWARLVEALPRAGRHLTATWDERSVTLYQAHPRPLAARLLLEQRLGGPGWRTDRTSQLRTSFTDLLARSDRGRAEHREVALAIRVRRDAFDVLLRQAVHAAFPVGVYPSRASWRLATRHAQVLVAWSAVPAPDGTPTTREAARLGARDHALRQLCDAVLAIEDLTGLAVADGPEAPVPAERAYPLDAALLGRLTAPAGG